MDPSFHLNVHSLFWIVLISSYSAYCFPQVKHEHDHQYSAVPEIHPQSQHQMEEIKGAVDEMEYQLDPIDLCIITCDSCYKDEAVVKCANECIVTDGKEMAWFWAYICPSLLPFYKESNTKAIVNGKFGIPLHHQNHIHK